MDILHPLGNFLKSHKDKDSVEIYLLNSITFFYLKVPWDDVAISGSLTGQNNSNWSSEQLFVGVMYADCTAGLASSNKTDYFHYFMLLYANTRPKTNLATTSRTKYHICERVEIFQESTGELMMDDTSNWLCSLSTYKIFSHKNLSKSDSRPLPCRSFVGVLIPGETNGKSSRGTKYCLTPVSGCGGGKCLGGDNC